MPAGGCSRDQQPRPRESNKQGARDFAGPFLFLCAGGALAAPAAAEAELPERVPAVVAAAIAIRAAAAVTVTLPCSGIEPPVRRSQPSIAAIRWPEGRKDPNPERVGIFVDGGGGGNRTRVQMPLHKQFYMRSRFLSSRGSSRNRLPDLTASRLLSRFSPSGPMSSDSMFMTPLPVNWPNPWKNWCGAGRY